MFMASRRAVAGLLLAGSFTASCLHCKGSHVMQEMLLKNCATCCLKFPSAGRRIHGVSKGYTSWYSKDHINMRFLQSLVSPSVGPSNQNVRSLRSLCSCGVLGRYTQQSYCRQHPKSEQLAVAGIISTRPKHMGLAQEGRLSKSKHG